MRDFPEGRHEDVGSRRTGKGDQPSQVAATRDTVASPGLPGAGSLRTARLSSAEVLRLQRSLGNAHVAHLLNRPRPAPARSVQRTPDGATLAAQARAGGYAAVETAIAEAGYFERDDLSEAVFSHLRTVELIRIGRTPAGISLLNRLRSELMSGWTTGGEAEKATVLAAMLGDVPARNRHNRARIDTIKGTAAHDLDALAKLFEDDQLIDDGTVPGRLQSILSSTAHLAVPGLQTRVGFGDTGFAGDQNPDGAGFRDPHPSSRNQPGHFLTAVGLRFSPDTVSRPIPMFGSVRQMIGAPGGMSDEDVALRLTIGHEKAPDPQGGPEILVDVVAVAIIENLRPGPEGETEEQRRQRVGQAIVAEVQRQIDEVIAAFRAQFLAATDADVAAWREALAALGAGGTLDMAAAEPILRRIAIDPTKKGNSIQDLRLSLVGWRLAQLLQSGGFADRAAVGGWIRRNLGT